MDEDKVAHALGRLEAEVKGCRQDIAEDREDNRARLNHHSDRIRGLETSRAKVNGIVAVLMFLSAGLGIDKLWRTFGG